MDSVIGYERNQSLHDVHPVTVEVIEKNRLVSTSTRPDSRSSRAVV
jgi:hypothetical protein